MKAIRRTHWNLVQSMVITISNKDVLNSETVKNPDCYPYKQNLQHELLEMVIKMGQNPVSYTRNSSHQKKNSGLQAITNEINHCT